VDEVLFLSLYMCHFNIQEGIFIMKTPMELLKEFALEFAKNQID